MISLGTPSRLRHRAILTVAAASVGGLLLAGCRSKEAPVAAEPAPQAAPVPTAAPLPEPASPPVPASDSVALPPAVSPVEAWAPPEQLATFHTAAGEQRLPLSGVRPLVDETSLRAPVPVQQLVWRTAATLWLTETLLRADMKEAEIRAIESAVATDLLEESSRAGSAAAWNRTQDRAHTTREARRAEAWVRAALTRQLIAQGEPPIDEARLVERYTKRQGRFTVPMSATLEVFSAPSTLPEAEASRRLTDAAAAVAAGGAPAAAATQHGVVWSHAEGGLAQLETPLERAVRAAQVGKATAVVRSGIGWQVAHVRAVRPEERLPLTAARPLVEAQLREEDRVGGRRAIRAKLLAAAGVRWTAPLDALDVPAEVTPATTP